MRSKFILLVFSFVLAFWFSGLHEQAFAKASQPSPEQLKKEHIIRSINLLRAAHQQPPLSFKNLAIKPQTLHAQKSADGSGTIAGTLFNIERDFIFSAVVVAWQADSSVVDSTGTVTAHFGKVDPSGSYRIENLEAGNYYVLALADSYVPKFYNNVTDFSDATTVPVKEGEVTAGIDFLMEKIHIGTGSVSGTVVSEREGDPIARAYVNVFSPENPLLYGWTETDENGKYTISGLNSGKYFGFCWAEGFLGEYYDGAASFEQATSFEVLEPNETSGIDFKLNRGGMISGVVTNDDGKPLANVVVQAYTDYRVVDPTDPPDSTIVYGFGYAITDDHGEYLIGGLPTGNYLVSAQVWNQWFYIFEWYDNVTNIEDATAVAVKQEEVTPGIDFKLAIPTTFGAIFGSVVDANNDPIEGAIVQAQSPFDRTSNGLQVWAYGYTDRRGNYRIDNLPDGDYLVSAYAQIAWQFAQRYWPDAETPEEAEPVVVNSATDPQPTDFKLPIRSGTASISGWVLRNTGEPILYAYIQLSSADASIDPATGVSGSVWAYASTDSNGNYRIDRLPAGEYIAFAQYWENESFDQQWFDHADSREQATIIALADGEHRGDINFDLTLRPYYGAIAGTVTDEANGTPINRAYVEITPLGFDPANGLAAPTIWPGFVWPYYAITNEQGNYQLEWLPEGEYYVSVYADGAFEYFENAPVPELATKVKVIGGETTAVNFGLMPRDEGDGVISGRVTDEWNSGALPIAIVIARPTVVPQVWPDSEKFFNAVTDVEGNYKITGLPAGEYVLFSFAPGYIGEYYDNVFDPAEAKVINVDENTPVTGIDFTLSPILWLRGCPECDNAAPGQSGGQIFGKVTDANGSIIRNATIYLLNDSEQPVSFAQSNAEGVYEMRSVPPGRYRLKATHLNYKSEYNNDAQTFADAAAVNVGNGALEINFVLESIVTGVDDEPAIPSAVELYGNFPNPFNPQTSIRFGLPFEMTVRLRIFNLLGQEVRTLDGGHRAAGEHAVSWDGRDQSGAVLPSGIYFYTLEANGQAIAVKKMTLLK